MDRRRWWPLCWVLGWLAVLVAIWQVNSRTAWRSGAAVESWWADPVQPMESGLAALVSPPVLLCLPLVLAPLIQTWFARGFDAFAPRVQRVMVPVLAVLVSGAAWVFYLLYGWMAPGTSLCTGTGRGCNQDLFACRFGWVAIVEVLLISPALVALLLFCRRWSAPRQRLIWAIVLGWYLARVGLITMLAPIPTAHTICAG